MNFEKTKQSDAPQFPNINLKVAIDRARSVLSDIQAGKIDSVRSCLPLDGGLWQATFDIVESTARLGENDLLSAYRVVIGPSGEIIEVKKAGVFLREDGLPS